MGRPSLVLAGAGLLLACTDDPEPPLPEVPAIEACEAVADWDPAHAAFEREVLELVNLRRAEGATCGAKGEFSASEPLSMNVALRCAARNHVADMIEGDYFEHEDPEGVGYVDRAALAEYDGEAVGQTIAAGQREPTQVVATWMSNDGNCVTLMDPDANELGVGYLPADEVTYSHYWAMVFGRREG